MGNASGAGIGAGWTQRQADLMIAAIACAWGSSYLMMQVGLSSIPPFGMVALRFGIALSPSSRSRSSSARGFAS